MRGDVNGLCQWLREHGAPAADVARLEHALRDASVGGVDRDVAAWIASTRTAVATGAWRAPAVDVRAITTRVLAFYGITIVG